MHKEYLQHYVSQTNLDKMSFTVHSDVICSSLFTTPISPELISHSVQVGLLTAVVTHYHVSHLLITIKFEILLHTFHTKLCE